MRGKVELLFGEGVFPIYGGDFPYLWWGFSYSDFKMLALFVWHNENLAVILHGVNELEQEKLN